MSDAVNVIKILADFLLTPTCPSCAAPGGTRTGKGYTLRKRWLFILIASIAATLASAPCIQAQTWWEYRSIEEAVWTEATDTEGTLWVVKGINDITKNTLALTNCQDLVTQITNKWVLRSTKIVWANEAYAGIKPCGDKNLGWVAVVESESYVKTGLKEQAFAFSMGEQVSCSPDDKALLLCVHVHVVETTNDLPNNPLPPWTPKSSTESVNLSINRNGSITEGGTPLVLTATLAGANTSGRAIQIPIQIRGTGTTAQPEDYIIASSISIADGSRTGTTTFTVTNDGEDETDETVIIELGSSLPVGINAGSQDRVTVTILDDDDSADNTDNAGTGGGTSGFQGGFPTSNAADNDSDEETASSDSDILLAIYRASGGNDWTHNNNWNSDKPLGMWYGVTTDSDARVTELRLEDNNLVGTLHEDMGKLEKLKILRLNDNKLSGAIPTAALETLLNLEELALWGNVGLSGAISDELGKRVDRAALRTLNEVNGGSSLKGWFPEDETDPFSYSFWNGVATNGNGRVSELDLSELELSGNITDAISALFALERLDLSGNPDLKGKLPPGLADLTNLRELDISGTGICNPESKEFAQWIESDHLTFIGNDNCGAEIESIRETQNAGGCAVASGGEAGENASRFILAALAIIAALLGNRLLTERRKLSSARGRR